MAAETRSQCASFKKIYHKADPFADQLFGDIFGCFAEAVNVDIDEEEEEDDGRFVPGNFYCDIITFSKTFLDKLLPDLSEMPVLLCYCERFFRGFTNSVCLKLIADEDPEVAFLKVMAFLMLITSMSFVQSCYRSLDDLPMILRNLLKDHINTSFYEDDRFEAISARSKQLKEDPSWYEAKVEEMRTYMRESLQTELAVANLPIEYGKPDISKIKIKEVRGMENELKTREERCPYCDTECLLLLKAFYKPRIVYKPSSQCRQM